MVREGIDREANARSAIKKSRVNYQQFREEGDCDRKYIPKPSFKSSKTLDSFGCSPVILTNPDPRELTRCFNCSFVN